MNYKQIQSIVADNGVVIKVGSRYKLTGESNRVYLVTGIFKNGAFGSERFVVTVETKDGHFAYDWADQIEKEVLPYDNLKIDDKVLVRDDELSPWLRRYFAGVNSDGKPTAFYDGKTSYSVNEDDRLYEWNYCVPYDPSIPNIDK